MPDAASDPSLPDALAIACATPRPQPYRLVHRALRSALLQVLLDAGRCNAWIPQARARLVERVDSLLAGCIDQLAHENHFLHEPLRERSPHAVLAAHYDHLDQLNTVDALRLLLQRLRDAHGNEAAALGHELHLRLSRFVADLLTHMAEEESTLTCAFWAHFSDTELASLIERMGPPLPLFPAL